MKFSDIPGHEDIKSRLREMVDNNRIPHALLIEGPEGVGKHALARAFLQYAGCSDKQGGDSCGICPSCRQHSVLQHIDTILSFPYVKRKNESAIKPTLSADYLPQFIEFITHSPFADETLWLEQLGMPNTKPTVYVEEAAELIRRLSYASHSSPFNAVILWKADRLNEAASNKLLKIIEEPPGRSVIILTTDRPMEILPTIYSRCQRIKVKRLTDDQVFDQLAKTFPTTPQETLTSVTALASGSIIEAIRLLAKNDDSRKFLEYFISLMRLAYMRDISALKEWAGKVATEKREIIVNFLEYMARMLRENFIANLHDSSLVLMTPDENDFSRNFARFINERNVLDLFDATGQAISDIRGNVNPRIVLFDLAITVILKLKS